MSGKTIVYTDDYGDVSEEQWKLYKERNVSPSDHDTLQEVYGRDARGRDMILAAVREFSRAGQYQEYDMITAARATGLI